MSQNTTTVLNKVNTKVVCFFNTFVLNSQVMKLTYGDRLRAARKHKGVSQNKLAEISGIGQGTISKIERGDQDYSAADIKLAMACDVHPLWLSEGDELFEPDWLTNGSIQGQLEGPSGIMEGTSDYHIDIGPMPNIAPGPDIKGKIPLINYVQAGQWCEIAEIHEPIAWIERTTDVSEKAFALRVIGDSMTNPFGAPSIPEGFIVIVDPEIQAVSGSIVVARLENSDEAVLKQLIIDGPHKYLKSLNPEYKPISIDQECLICGVVKKVQYDL